MQTKGGNKVWIKLSFSLLFLWFWGETWEMTSLLLWKIKHYVKLSLSLLSVQKLYVLPVQSESPSYLLLMLKKFFQVFLDLWMNVMWGEVSSPWPLITDQSATNQLLLFDISMMWPIIPSIKKICSRIMSCSYSHPLSFTCWAKCSQRKGTFHSIIRKGSRPRIFKWLNSVQQNLPFLYENTIFKWMLLDHLNPSPLSATEHLRW